MKRPKVIVAEFQHETNVFCQVIADRRAFEEFYFHESAGVLTAFGGTGTIMGGFLKALADEDAEVVPVLATQANPCGLVTREMFEFARDRIVDALAAHPDADGVLLGLHGAMVSEAALDSEGALLEAIRAVAGPRRPIVGTLDLHGNLTPKMVTNADVFFPYESYPHTDCFERGCEAGRCVLKMIRGEIRPVMKLRQVPVLAHFVETSAEPHRSLLPRVRRWKETAGVVNAAYLHGFPWSDVPDAGVSVLAVTDGDEDLANRIADDLADAVWQSRDRFQKKLYTPEEAVAIAMQFPGGPVIIADVADNPGGGGSGDSTFILSALKRAGATDVGFAVIADPEAVAQAILAGVGAEVRLSLGGKLAPPEISGGPLEIRGTVRTIADGRFCNKGPMMKGLQNHIGRTVVVDSDGVEIIIPEWRMQPFDAEVFRRLGIEPSGKKILVLKSAVHFRASYGEMAKKIIEVDTPEYGTMNFASLPFNNIRRPVYPLDEQVDYAV
jgi:microcystin degradation protein MlrC